MPTDDVVAELDHWLGGSVQAEPHLILKRARDEIVALRKALHAEMMGRPNKWHVFIVEARNEALEEAARLHEQVYVGHHQDAMGAVIEYRDLIRALKDKRDE